jgi:hypothetical protein
MRYAVALTRHRRSDRGDVNPTARAMGRLESGRSRQAGRDSAEDTGVQRVLSVELLESLVSMGESALEDSVTRPAGE